MADDIITQVDVERRIIHICDLLDETLAEYRIISEQRAVAESDYKHRYSRAMLDQITKTTVSSREATAHLRASDDYREWRILETRERATQQMLTSLRSQLDALRTLAANVRVMTR